MSAKMCEEAKVMSIEEYALSIRPKSVVFPPYSLPCRFLENHSKELLGFSRFEQLQT
jgi:hypothetical protein